MVGEIYGRLLSRNSSSGYNFRTNLNYTDDAKGIKSIFSIGEVNPKLFRDIFEVNRNGTFMKAPNGNPTNLTERQWLQVRTKAFKDWFGDWEKAAKIIESFKQFKNKYNGKEYESTDEFRRVQEESRTRTDAFISELHERRSRERFDNFKRDLSIIYGRLLTRVNGAGFNSRADLTYTDPKTGKTNTFPIGEVNPKLFHDIFEVNRRYLPNGELVDIHDDYSECKCFITDDGLAGFAIEPDGNLISVFSLNPSNKRGFLYAIKNFIRKEGASI